GWCLLPVVVAAVHVADRQFGEFCRRHVIETGDVDRIIGSADFLDISVTERRDAARLAEPMVSLHATELVIGQFEVAGEQPKVLGHNDSTPIASLGADRAVAPPRPGAEVDVGLETNSAAVT